VPGRPENANTVLFGEEACAAIVPQLDEIYGYPSEREARSARYGAGQIELETSAQVSQDRRLRPLDG
jgi:hypothetical protein